MKQHLSFSAWTQYKTCEARALAMDKGEWDFPKSDAMLVSTYVELLLIGDEAELEEFFAKNPEVLNSRTGEPKAAFKNAEIYCEKAKEDPVFMAFLQGQHQVPLEGEIGGVLVRGFADTISEDYISDLKAVANFNRAWNPATRTKESFIEQRKYPTQGAIYQELYYQKTGKRLPFYLVALTKEEYSKRAIASFEQEKLDMALDMFMDSLPRIIAIRSGEETPEHCGDCDYCRSTMEAQMMDYKFIGMSREEVADYFRFQFDDREE